MKLWLDDVRQMPFDYDLHVKTAPHAITLIKTGLITCVSLDHDLGDIDHEGNPTGTGRDVASKIEEMAYYGALTRIEWHVHSANPVGVEAMEAALRNADKYWNWWREGIY